MENKWISVKDRLPESLESVITYDDDEYADKFCCVNEGFYDNEWYFVRDGYKPVNITHWIPLPDPPKGD